MTIMTTCFCWCHKTMGHAERCRRIGKCHRESVYDQDWKVGTTVRFDICPVCKREVMVDWDNRPDKIYWTHDKDLTSMEVCAMSGKAVETPGD